MLHHQSPYPRPVTFYPSNLTGCHPLLVTRKLSSLSRTVPYAAPSVRSIPQTSVYSSPNSKRQTRQTRFDTFASLGIILYLMVRSCQSQIRRPSSSLLHTEFMPSWAEHAGSCDLQTTFSLRCTQWDSSATILHPSFFILQKYLPRSDYCSLHESFPRTLLPYRFHTMDTKTLLPVISIFKEQTTYQINTRYLYWRS